MPELLYHVYSFMVIKTIFTSASNFSQLLLLLAVLTQFRRVKLHLVTIEKVGEKV